MWGHWSFLLGPGAHNLLFVPSKSLFPQSCVSSGTSLVGLMVTSSKRAYVIPRSTTPRAPALQQSTADPYLHRRHSNTVLSQSLWGHWVLVRRWEEKGMTEDEVVGWHHRLNRHESEPAPGGGDGQGSLAYCSPWGRKELDMTEQLNRTEHIHHPT